jgi:hypothetical protein
MVFVSCAILGLLFRLWEICEYTEGVEMGYLMQKSSSLSRQFARVHVSPQLQHTSSLELSKFLFLMVLAVFLLLFVVGWEMSLWSFSLEKFWTQEDGSACWSRVSVRVALWF